MSDIILSIIGFFMFAIMVAVALWFGAALLLFVVVSSFFLSTFIILRGYYLRWKYHNSPAPQPPENPNQVGHTTIIDVEYTEVKNPKDGL